MPYDHVGVIGSGSWGTALAIAAARAGRRVTLWGRTADIVEEINRRRTNSKFLPGLIPAQVTATGTLSELSEADAVLLVVPAQHVRTILSDLQRHLRDSAPVVICAKGIERNTGRLMSEVAAEFLSHEQVGILSGPSFARDVANGLPTAVTIAASSATGQRLQVSLGHGSFRPYASEDVIGVALGGAAKNVYAIACGIVHGMRLGESARAALIARSFAELRRLGEALGGRRETLMGLSGLGDLVLTATSSTSRNFAFGVAIGNGNTRAKLDARGHPLAEGVETAPALVARARQEGVELPVAETTSAILGGVLSLDAAVPRLMSRPLKAE
jgi:glycerol-3-phosphate dehydrogenase (NAD(P)+)